MLNTSPPHTLRNSLLLACASLLAVIAISVGGLKEFSTRTDHYEQVNWKLFSPSGQRVSFPAKSEGPTILLFWASWCPYSGALMQELQALSDEYVEPLTIYAINFRDKRDPQAFMDSRGFDFELLIEGDAVARDYGMWETPAMLLFDKDNQLILNLYDVMARYPATDDASADQSYKEKAALKAAWWTEQIRAALIKPEQSKPPDSL